MTTQYVGCMTAQAGAVDSFGFAIAALQKSITLP
jgi:hypothetical protein